MREQIKAGKNINISKGGLFDNVKNVKGESIWVREIKDFCRMKILNGKEIKRFELIE